MTPQQILCVKQALTAIEQREIQAFEQLNDPIPPFSERFERKMQKLIRVRNSAYYPLIKTPARKFATIMIAIFLMFSLSLSVSAIREPIFSAMERITAKFTEIVFPNKTETPFVEYKFGWIPDNYTQTFTVLTDNSANTEWKYLDSYICFEQTNFGNVQYNTEGVIIHHAEWANKRVSYYQKYNNYLFSWEENSYLFSLVCTTDLSLDDIRRMIESIHPTESLPITQGGK